MKRRDFLSWCAAAGMAASANVLEAQESQSSSRIKLEGNVEITKAMIVTPEQARVYSQGLGEAHILVDGERSGGSWWLGEFREDPGFMTSLHFHYQQDEQFFVLDGVLSVYVDGRWHDLEPGTIAVVPHGMQHAQGNTGKKPVRFLGSGNPAGFERFFAELDKLVSHVPPSDPQFGAEVAKILVRYDTKPLGPAPPRT
jgi:mannose-6-phosphate isomerase-like protein (cupin superfamily)